MTTLLLPVLSVLIFLLGAKKFREKYGTYKPDILIPTAIFILLSSYNLAGSMNSSVNDASEYGGAVASGNLFAVVIGYALIFAICYALVIASMKKKWVYTTMWILFGFYLLIWLGGTKMVQDNFKRRVERARAISESR